jgi:hypothetical protein
MVRKLNIWRPRYAVLPTRMDDGDLVWLRGFEEMQTMLRYTDNGDEPYIVTRRRLPPERMIP